MLSQDSEDEKWSRFVFELVIWPQEVTLARWTQPSGLLCLWQYFLIENCIAAYYALLPALYPRASTPSLSVSSGGSRGCTPPLNRWDGAGSSRFPQPRILFFSIDSCTCLLVLADFFYHWTWFCFSTDPCINQEWVTIEQKSFKVSFLWKAKNSPEEELGRRQLTQHIHWGRGRKQCKVKPSSILF